MKREFQVDLDAETQINHCIGSKTAYSMLPACFINPGDITMMTVPGYPVAGTHTKYYGGTVYRLPLLAENHFYPDFSQVTDETWERTKMLVVNYPNSPTGQVATSEFYAELVELAHKHKFVVVQDAAHILLSFRGKPLSFLQTPGVCGNATIVQAFSDVKDNCDSGQFGAVQRAAITGLDSPDIPKRINTKYRRRLEKLVACLRDCGFTCEVPGGSYFLYTKTPKGIKGGPLFANAEEASQYFITQHSMVTVPWDDAGSFLRFSVTYEANDEAGEDRMMAETRRRIGSLSLVF